MCRKSIYLTSFVLVLCITAGVANAHLVAYWPMDEGSGTTVGDATGTWDGTITGSVTWVDGKEGMALEFPGGQNYVNFGNVEIGSDLTLAYWCFNPEKAFERPIGQHSGDYTTDPGWCVLSRNEGEGTVWFRVHGADDAWNGGDIIIPDILSKTEWYHLTFTFDGTTRELKGYLNGELKVSKICEAGRSINPNTNDLRMGHVGSAEPFVGMLDEVAVWNHVLTEDEILAVIEGHMGGANPYAFRPDPSDGAMHEDTWITLSWKPGAFAVSHDVYMGDNFDDVNDGLGDTFRGSQDVDLLYYVAGFTGYAYPDGLVNGTTYYWRIDEVNEADPNSPWKGDVWSFTVPPRKAYEPVPANGAKFIDSSVTLSWTGGFGVKLHYVYFGEDYDTVANATDGEQHIFTEYSPDSLESEKTYYWRVDESDGVNTYTGDVWSFKTMPDIPIADPNLVAWWKLDEGSGNTALDWSGHGNHGTLYGDPQRIIGYDGDALDFDGSNDYVGTGKSLLNNIPEFTVTGWVSAGNPESGRIGLFGQNDVVEFGFQGGDIHIYTSGGGEARTAWTAPNLTWHHIAAVGNGTNLKVYVDGVLVVSGGTVTDSYGSSSSGFNIGGGGVWDAAGNWLEGQIDDVRVYDKELTADEVKETMRGDPLVAWDPSPVNGSTPDIDSVLPLSWSPGDKASQHDVYFGTDKAAVEDADASDTSGTYRGSQSDTSYTPPEGVEWGSGPYYWRIDENNNDGTVTKGRVWTFTVADFVLVDDFESYNAGDNQIWYAWHDGLGYGALGTDPYFAGNGTGAAVGDETTASYTEETIVNSGGQSMPLSYDNNKQGYSKYSEAELTLTAPRDWTKNEVKELSLWFRGYPASVGSFVEGPVGTYTMTGSGWDIEGNADGFHFAYKTLTGVGSIVAKIESVENTHVWAKAGVMIRETLEPGSVQAMTVITPEQGVSFQRRIVTDDVTSNTTTGGIVAPYWVKLERSISGLFTASHSANGSTWTVQGTETISMGANVYVGLALTSHDAALTCQALFTNVTTTGTVSQQWANQDIGITSNAAEPLYVAVSNSTGTPAVVVHDDPAAATIDTWTEWVIPLQALADQGIVLTNVDRIAIGLGTQGNMTVPGRSGKMFFDDIRLYRQRDAAE